MAYFITESELKSRTVLPSNISIELLRPWFIPAQNEFIKPILGTALYDELEDAVDANTLTANQTTLLSYVKDTLAYYIQYKAYPFIHTQTSNKGVLVKSTENGQSVDLAALNYLMKLILATAETYANLLKCYLDDNKALFTNYRCYPKSDLRFSGIQFGGCKTKYNKGYCLYCNKLYCSC